MKRTLALILLLAILTTLASCKKTDSGFDKESSSEAVGSADADDTGAAANYTNVVESVEFELTDFDRELIGYLSSNGYYYSDLVVSPASFRASLCLAAAGAKGDTRAEILSAAGFSDMNDMELWYSNYRRAVTSAPFSEDGETSAVGSFVSVWSNEELLGEFTDIYKELAEDKYNSDARSADTEDMSTAINDWISSRSGGMMKSVDKDVTGASSVLISSVYMQGLLNSGFTECEHGRTGFAEKTGDFLYAKENGTEILAIPVGGNMSLVFFVGNRTDMFEKLSSLKREKVHAVVPEFETKSLFDSTDMLNFLIARGLEISFDGSAADFDGMCQDSDWFMQEIIHASKLSVTGASAAVSSGDGTASSQRAEVKEFVADGQFSYAVFSDFGTDKRQLLLYGQMQE